MRKLTLRAGKQVDIAMDKINDQASKAVVGKEFEYVCGLNFGFNVAAQHPEAIGGAQLLSVLAIELSAAAESSDPFLQVVARYADEASMLIGAIAGSTRLRELQIEGTRNV